MKTLIIYTLLALSIFIVACGTTETVSTEKENSKPFAEKTKKTVEKSTATEGTLTYEGKFHDADKTGSGTASVYENKDGKRILKLSDFKTANGPDLFVYVFKAKDANDAASLKNVEYVSLGRLKSISGDQEYEIPANLDLDQFQAVSIWCEEFTVNFAVAPITGKS